MTTASATPGPFTGRGERIAKHGTNSGYQAHINYGTKPCQECRDARAQYQRERRARGKNAR